MLHIYACRPSRSILVNDCRAQGLKDLRLWLEVEATHLLKCPKTIHRLLLPDSVQRIKDVDSQII